MKRAKGTLKSLCPLLMDRFGAALEPTTTPDDYKKQAEYKAYRDDKGNLAIAANALKAVIRESASALGPVKGGKSRREEIRACVFISPVFISLGKKKFDGIADHTVTRGKGEKVTRVVTYRPQINEWTAEFTIEMMDNVNPDFIRQCIEYGGLRKGFYGYRPEYGRFELADWKVMSES